MASVQVLTSIAIILISFLAGICFFYVINPQSTTRKKELLGELVSQLINFIIFIWAAKVILNLKLFMGDPLAVLAYPSNSNAFYLAILLTVSMIGYKVKRHQFHVKDFLMTFIPVFIMASFVYEFIEIVWQGDSYAWKYLGLLTILLVLYMILLGRTSSTKLTYHLLSGWALGKLILSLYLPFTAVFGYTTSTWFLMVLSILLLMLNRFTFRKKVLSWAE